MTYSIGTFTFVTLNRLGGRGEGPEGLNIEPRIISRPGPDGVNVRREGIRGRPFQMRSTAVFATNTAVLEAQSLYYSSQAQTATLTWEGVNTVHYGVAYVILRVSEPHIERLGAAAYLGADITNWWKIQVTWDLLPVDANHVITA